MVDKPALLREAKEDLTRGRYDEARDKYKQLLRADKLDVDGMTGLARAALGKGQFDEARTQAERALVEQPDLLDAKILRLVAIEAAGDPVTALGQMQTLAEEHPSSCLAAYHTGRLLAQKGEAERALPWLERAAEQALRTSQRYEIRNLMGYVLQELGRVGEAVRAHQQALELSPKRTAAYAGLADAMSRSGDVDAGLAMLDEAERNIGQHAELLSKQAELLARKGDLPAAQRAALRAGQRRPDDAAAWLAVTQLSLATGDLEAAREAARRACNAAPESWQAHFHLGLAYDATDEGEKAERAYREALRREPDSWQPANNLGLVLLARGDAEALAEATTLFEQAAKLAGNAAVQPQFNRALALARQQDAKAFHQLCGQLLRRELPAAMREKLEALKKALAAEPD